MSGNPWGGMRDLELLRRAAAGDQRAFEEIEAGLGPAVVRWLRQWLPEPWDCDDVYQEVWMKVFKNLDRIDPTRNFVSWVYKIAFSSAMDVHRGRRRRREVPLEGLHETEADEESGQAPVEYISSGKTPLEELEARESVRAVWECVEEMPPNARYVLHEVYSGGPLQKEIAKKYGVRDSQISRWKSEVRDCIQKRRNHAAAATHD